MQETFPKLYMATLVADTDPHSYALPSQVGKKELELVTFSCMCTWQSKYFLVLYVKKSCIPVL